MIIPFVFLTGALFLGWSLGRNNLSNLFGPAIGTRMLPLKAGVLVASIFVFLGAIISGYATTQNVNAMADIKTVADAFIVCVAAGIVLYLLSYMGIPASITQTSTGALISWNLFYQLPLNIQLIIKMVLGWVYAPVIAGILAFISFYFMRFLLKRFPVKLLWRDHLIRFGLLSVGAFSAYALGANNMASIVGPYVSTQLFSIPVLFSLACVAVIVGFMCADRRVIKTMSKGMFPLSPMEAFIVVLTSASTLFCFSSTDLKAFLTALSLPSLPLVPVPLSGAAIGAIVGIALAKGIDGLKWKAVGQIACSWIAAPLSAGLICYGILFFCQWGGLL